MHAPPHEFHAPVGIFRISRIIDGWQGYRIASLRTDAGSPEAGQHGLRLRCGQPLRGLLLESCFVFGACPAECEIRTPRARTEASTGSSRCFKSSLDSHEVSTSRTESTPRSSASRRSKSSCVVLSSSESLNFMYRRSQESSTAQDLRWIANVSNSRRFMLFTGMDEIPRS